MPAPTSPGMHLRLPGPACLQIAPMAGGLIDIQYAQVQCTPPSPMTVLVDQNRGAGGWIRLQISVSLPTPAEPALQTAQRLNGRGAFKWSHSSLGRTCEDVVRTHVLMAGTCQQNWVGPTPARAACAVAAALLHTCCWESTVCWQQFDWHSLPVGILICGWVAPACWVALQRRDFAGRCRQDQQQLACCTSADSCC